jgi:hypothetical protein
VISLHAARPLGSRLIVPLSRAGLSYSNRLGPIEVKIMEPPTTPNTDKAESPDPSPPDEGRTKELNDYGELQDILYRATLVSRHYNVQLAAEGIRGNSFDVTFTTLLLGFLASNVPLAQWFRTYVRDANVAVGRMLSSKKLDRQALEKLAAEDAPHDFGWSATHVASEIIRSASELASRGHPPASLGVRHYMAAYIYHCPKDHEKKLAAWRFKRVNWSNAFLSYIKWNSGVEHSELERWMEIHRETFKEEPRIPRPVPPTPLAPPDVTPLHLDNPSDADYLGRRGFTEALGERLNNVWRECNREESEGEVADVRSSFVLHVHGPWGSGKTSLLKFLRRELQPPREPEEKRSLLESLVRRFRPPREEDYGEDERMRWVVVEFNAWQHQRISPPWWSLLDTVYTRACKQLADAEVFGERLHAWRVRLRERWWRLSTLRKDYLTATVIASFALTAFVFWYRWGGDGWNMSDVAKSAGTALTTVVGFWSAFLLAGRSLLPGSARSAQSFMETAGDPMERVCGHFRKLVSWVSKPVVIFIDDLDRCQPKYVVDLLEGVQTLFSDPRVVYVIAADRRWLNTCFETSYESFAKAVKEPGRRLGSLFLEKAFELTVSVPPLPEKVKQAYWNYLVGGAESDFEREIERASAEVQNDFLDAETEEQVLMRLSMRTGDPLRDQIRLGAAVRRLANRKLVASTEYFLKPFAPLLEPNPRAMKRLVNAYSVMRDTALLAGVDVLGDIEQREQLALWAIVSVRWPLLEEYLRENPSAVDDIYAGRIADGAEALIHDEELRKLAASADVKRVFEGGKTPGIKTRGLSSKMVWDITFGVRDGPNDYPPGGRPLS